MPESDPPQRVHILMADDWRDAVKDLLRPDPEIAPWHRGPQQHSPGEAIAMVLNTEPRSIVTVLGRVGSAPVPEYALMPVSALRGPDYGFDDDAIETWLLEGELAEQLAAELSDNSFGWENARWGHHSMAAAAILLRAASTCDGCGKSRVLEPRTVDLNSNDYPAALCRACRKLIRDNVFHSFLDFKIAKNPECPQCAAHRTRAVAYGMPVFHAMVPWYQYAGCCVSHEQWNCLECDHSW